MDLPAYLREKAGVTSKDFNFTVRNDVNGNRTIIGKDFRSELLLYGFYCEGIRDDQWAVHEKYGYHGHWDRGDFLGIIGSSNLGKDIYYVDKVLWRDLSKSRIYLDCRAEVGELLNVQT
jgi:hypothetical protein